MPVAGCSLLQAKCSRCKILWSPFRHIPQLESAGFLLPATSMLPAISRQTAAAVPLPASTLLHQTASTGVGAIKWAAAAGLLAGAAGLGTTTVAACAAAGATFGGIVWIAEMASVRAGWQLPHVSLQHGLCNELHTLAGGLLGSAPVAAALTTLAAALATRDGGSLELGSNGLAFLTAMVACPAVVLLGAGARAASAEMSADMRQLLVHGAPLLTVGAVLVAPALVMHATGSHEAATRFVIGFGTNMAGAVVREALTQTTARAWSGIERNGSGPDYGLRQAHGPDRAGSTVVPTLTSCLLFAASSSLLLHQVEQWAGLGVTLAGQSILATSAAEAARRTVLRSTVMQSTNELLEGIARCLPLAGYAFLRDIPLTYRHAEAGLPDVPAALQRNARNPAAWRAATLFAAARTLDGALPNLLGQLSNAVAPGRFWTGYRIAAALAQGATMARSPLLAAFLLPAAEEAGNAPTSNERQDVVIAITAMVADSPASSDDAVSTASPVSEPSLQWA